MSRWLQRLGLGLAMLLILAGIAQSQQQGGAFVPAFSYLISGQWTWSQATPLVFEGATNNNFETSFTFTDPTADRTITFPDGTGTVLLGGGSTNSGIRAGVVGTGAANPTSVTTGLSALTSCNTTLVMSNSPASVTSPPLYLSVQLTASAGRLDIYKWATSGASTAPIQVAWLCSGTA